LGNFGPAKKAEENQVVFQFNYFSLRLLSPRLVSHQPECCTKCLLEINQAVGKQMMHVSSSGIPAGETPAGVGILRLLLN